MARSISHCSRKCLRGTGRACCDGAFSQPFTASQAVARAACRRGRRGQAANERQGARPAALAQPERAGPRLADFGRHPLTSKGHPPSLRSVSYTHLTLPTICSV
eukprot:11817529-Alexandrium_andersonii.AAC.1